MRLSLAGVLLLLCAATASAATERAAALFVSADTASRDGRLADTVWQNAVPVSAFVQREPTERGRPSEATEFRVAYDPTTLFVAVHAFDRQPDKIATYLSRRDDTSCPCDWIHVLIDSYHDRRTAFEFAVNPSGVKVDRYWFNDTNNDTSWDAVWDVTVSRDQSGWSAEFRIPLSQLRFARRPDGTVGFAILREIGRLSETDTWPLLARSANGFVSSFGELTGLSMVGSTKRLELAPYTVASVDRQSPAGNPLLSPSSAGASAGLDLRYRLTSGLMLTATVNPDFGQVEADPAVVNLSAFETFFQEQRPFFVEGSGIFRFDADCYDGCNTMFYSRRIGRPPQGTSNLPSGDGIFVDAPGETTIAGAAKLTGRIGAYSIGVLEAATTEQIATVADGTLPLTHTAVEPPTHYTVARVRREFANESYIGFMGTATNRNVAGDGLSFLPDSAYAGGIDFDWRLLGLYSLNGFVESSRVNGTTDAIADLQTGSAHYFQRPDLSSARFDPTRTSLTGEAGALNFGKIGGEHLRFNSNVYFRSPGFDTNDLGFLQRADEIQTNSWLQIRSDVPTRWFRNRTINFNFWRAWNFDGDRRYGGYNVNAWFTFKDNSTIGGGIAPGAAGVDDRVARGGPAVRTNPARELWLNYNSDNRRMASFAWFGDWQRDGLGTTFTDLNPGVTLRPVPALMLSIGVHLNHTVNDWQWVDNVVDASSTHYVFGHLDQTTVSTTARLNYTVTPTLSLQLYGQPFVSAGAYTGFKELAEPRALEYGDRFAAYGYAGDPDFNVKSFRTTNVLRWEYRPGSTLFVVWQQARENDAVPGGFSVSRDTRAIFGVPPHNTFLVKLAYWLNY